MSSRQPSSENDEDPISWWAALAFVLGFGFACLVTKQSTHGQTGGEVLGHLIGSVSIPLLISYLIAGRGENGDWNKVSLWFLVLSLCFYVLDRLRGFR